MKGFLIRVLIAFCIMMALLGVAEWMARSCPNCYSYKAEWMKSHADEVETLIVGSSLTYVGIKAEMLSSDAFNVANYSQSPRFDWLFLSNDSARLRKLKTVIIPASSMINSRRRLEDLESAAYRVTYYNNYCGCDDHSMFSKYAWQMCYFTVARDKILATLHIRKAPDLCDSLGCSSVQPVVGTNESLSEKVMQAEKTRFNSAIASNKVSDLPDYSGMIADWCNRHGVRLVVVGVPIYRPFYKLLNEEIGYQSMIDSGLADYMSKYPNIIFKDYSADSRFGYSDFHDMTHLNSRGAKKFTNIIKKDLDL